MFGLNLDVMNPAGNPTGSELADLGVKMARYTYHDPNPGPALDPARIEFYKGRVADLYSNGVDSLFILTYDTLPGKPSFDAPAAEWDAYINTFAAKAEQIAAIFGPAGVALQIWNEPDLAPAPGYEPSLRPEVYAKMLERAGDAISAVSYQTVIVGAGLASGDPGWWKKVYSGQRVDVLAIHPYGQRPEPDWPNPGWGFGYVGDLITAYQKVWKDAIWITESGDNTQDQNEQAEYLTRMYATIERDYQPPVDNVFWFCYSDGMVPPYGLRMAGGQYKPAYGAYQAAANKPLPQPSPVEVEPPPADCAELEAELAELRARVAAAIKILETI